MPGNGAMLHPAAGVGSRMIVSDSAAQGVGTGGTLLSLVGAIDTKVFCILSNPITSAGT